MGHGATGAARIVRAAAAITASASGISRLRMEPPLALRRCGDAVYVVGSAGGPVGGDDVHVAVRVERGATLRLRSAAAQVVLGALDGAESRNHLSAHVAGGGALDGALEPTVLTAGCRHRADVTVRVERGGRLRWQELLVLGRWGERPGVLASRLRVVVDSVPVIHHEIDLHPASIGSARVVGVLAAIDPAWDPQPPEARPLGGAGWWLPAERAGGLALALGGNVATVAAALALAPQPCSSPVPRRRELSP
jgi:urease accessory protein